MTSDNFQGVFLPQTQCSQNKLQIHLDSDQDEVVAENEWISDLILVIRKKKSLKVQVEDIKI